MMRAGVVVQPRRAEILAASAPHCAPNQLLVRVEGCGVCGSNLPVWEGRPWFTYPLAPGAPGHEAWGVVEEMGADVSGFRPGDRVALLAESGFAEFLAVPSDRAVLIPKSLGDVPVPAEPLACAVNVARRCAVQPGESVAIVGIGFLGALLVRLTKMVGAQVVAISRRKFARDMGERFGADASFSPDEIPSARETVSSNSAGFDCVIECAGAQETLDASTRLTRERGRLAIAGYHQDGLRQVDMQLWNWRGLDVINAHERDAQVYLDGMRAAIEAVANGVLDPTPLYTHRFSLGELGSAFEMLRSRPPGFMKALVYP